MNPVEPTRLIVKVQVVVHEAAEPDAVRFLTDAHELARKDLAEIDLPIVTLRPQWVTVAVQSCHG
jgi:hypothetical protein